MSTPRFDIVGLGENSVDLVLSVPEPPTIAGAANKVRILDREVRCGGQTATAVTAAARLGLRAAYVGAFGHDEYSTVIRSSLKRDGIDVSHAQVREAPNRYAVILIDRRTGERMVLWDRDPRLALEADAVPDVLVTTDVDRLDDIAHDVLKTATHAIVAEHVPLEMTGIDDLDTAVRAMRQTIAGVIVVTRGAKGSMALDTDGTIVYEAGFPVATQDATGAGDVFRGGFAYGLVQGWPIHMVLRFANAAAAISVTRHGAIDGAPRRDEVEPLVHSRD
jgi:sugar/nucleoside kinase (ribokinase family)